MSITNAGYSRLSRPPAAPTAVAKAPEPLTEASEGLVKQVMETLNKQGYDIKPSDPVLQHLTETLRRYRDSAVTEHHVAAAYAAIYMKVADSRKKLVKDIDRMRSFYLVEVILNQISDDALAPEIGTGEIINVSSDRTDIQSEIDWLEERYDFDQLLTAISSDLLAYGDYMFKTKVNVKPDAAKLRDVEKEAGRRVEALQPKVDSGAATDDEAKELTECLATIKKIQETIEVPDSEYGLQELEDSVDFGSVVPITRYKDVIGYLERDNQTGKMVRKHPTEYVTFSLQSQRIKVDLFREIRSNNQDDVPDELKNLPRFVRVGKSAIYPVLAKLKELELLEALVPATKLSKLSGGTVIGVQVPAGMEIDHAVEAAKKVEGLINKKVGIDDKLGELTIENIMTAAGRLKCVPIFGDKGQLSKLDYKNDEPDDLLASVTDIRKVILTSVGVPYELVFGGEDADKASILKKYARYLRKIKSVQKALEEGVRQIIYIHLSNKGIQYKSDDIKVSFHQKLIEVDQLDHLEFADTIVSMLANVRDFILSLAAPESPVRNLLDLNALAKYLNENLNIIGFTNLINMEGIEAGKVQVPLPDAGGGDPSMDGIPVGGDAPEATPVAAPPVKLPKPQLRTGASAKAAVSAV